MFVINLPERTDRLAHFKEQIKYLGVSARIVDGIRQNPSHKGIAQTHINCLMIAKQLELDDVLIMEDDIVFQGKEKTKDHYFECMQHAPNDWDILLGGVYMDKGIKKINEWWSEIGDFSGLHFYMVNSKAYDRIIDGYDNTMHIDRWMGQNKDLKKYVMNTFIATQMNGLSDNTGKKENYDRLLKKYKLL
jgi:GR25 family glycosyltransferase involved in LPS biosynthesis